MPELAYFFVLFPYLYYIIILIPFSLIFDFGIFFLAYLRGVGPSPIMILESLYDYIACSAFFIRILVQGVRLLLMIFTTSSINEYIMMMNFDQHSVVGSEVTSQTFKDLIISSGVISFFALSTVVNRFTNLAYELLHTLFVVTAQFAAFFAMVF